jgi:hypothetical protein
LALGRVGRAPGFLAPGNRLVSAEGFLPGSELGFADGRRPGRPLGFDAATGGFTTPGAPSDRGPLMASFSGVGPNSCKVNSPSLFLSSFFRTSTAASISLRESLPSLLASNAANSWDGLDFALTMVGPEAGWEAPGLAGFATSGLPFGLRGDWAKPAMASPNPNTTMIVLFLIISN